MLFLFTSPLTAWCSDNVEMEIVLPGNMTVRESHDLALALQHKIESLEEVERAFVHVSVAVVVIIIVVVAVLYELCILLHARPAYYNYTDHYDTMYYYV